MDFPAEGILILKEEHMNSMNYIFVVGDQFQRITNVDAVMVYSDFMDVISHDYVQGC